MASATISLIPGMDKESWYARVDTSEVLSLRPDAVLEKKKLAARRPASAQIPAIVLAMADFPAPAGPYIQRMNELRISWSSIQDMIHFKIAFLVSGWHFGASYSSSESWNAPGTMFLSNKSQPISEVNLFFPGVFLGEWSMLTCPR